VKRGGDRSVLLANFYLSRDNRLDFIRYYIPDYDNETEDEETIYGGYGR
jgi:hypothetical protein